MKRTVRWVAALAGLALLAGCAPTGPGPRVWIDAPLHGSTLAMGSVEVVTHGAGSSGVAEFELSVGGSVAANSAGQDNGKGLVMARQNWRPAAPGNYVLMLRARDRNGVWGEPARADVTVLGDRPVPTTTSTATVPPRPTAAATASPTAPPAAVATKPPSPTPSSTPTGSEIDAERRTATPTVRAAEPPAERMVDDEATSTPTPVQREILGGTARPTSGVPLLRVLTPTAEPRVQPTRTATASRPSQQTPTPTLDTSTIRRITPAVPTLAPSKPTVGSPSLSTAQFYWGDSGCGPKQATISVSVTDPAGMSGVRIYYRLVDKAAGTATGWGSGDMAKSGDVWSETIDPALEGPSYSSWANAWLQFYFVATNARGSQAQSPSYASSLTLSRCIRLR